MKGQMKMINCDPTCGFMVKGHDESELMDLAMRHVKNSHPDMKMSMAEVKAQVKNA